MVRPALDAWDVSETHFPTGGTPEDKLRFLLAYAVLAPSGHNTQPWRFRIRGPVVELYADTTRSLPVVDPGDRELLMSCGAALLHLRLALKHFGHAPLVELLPDSNLGHLVARVRMGGPVKATILEDAMFRAIPKRHTHRAAFEDRLVPSSLLASLHAVASEEDAWLQPIQGEEARRAVADLIAQGDRMQASDPSFRRELAGWVRANRSRKRDGIPGYALGMRDWASALGPLVLGAFDWGKGQAEKDRALALASPVLVVLGTDDDGPHHWLAAGQALAKVLLCAAVEGVSASFLNQPIEVGVLRPKLRDALGGTGFPQLLLRMGYGRPQRPSPRRPASEFLS